MALTQENVHYTLNSGPGVMNSCADPGTFFRRGGGGGGGGGVKAQRPENSLDNVFLVINLFYNLQSGSNGFITEGRRGSNFFKGVGVSKETHITSKRKKSYLLLIEIASADPEGVRGPDPLENHKLYGFL